jgi:hypothetical protein
VCKAGDAERSLLTMIERAQRMSTPSRRWRKYIGLRLVKVGFSDNGIFSRILHADARLKYPRPDKNSGFMRLDMIIVQVHMDCSQLAAYVLAYFPR